jgi:flagellar basal-body rod modification protein FlgD
VIANQITAEGARTDFLQLLVAQMRNQDPLNPVQQHDMLGQLAQFSTLEGIENLNANFRDMLKLQELTQGASLLGRTVSYIPNDSEGTLAQDVVEAIQVEDGNLVLTVNGNSVPIDDIEAVIA